MQKASDVKAAVVKAPKASLLGRYKVIVIAVAFFLVFDLGVLILNFYTSFKIAEDALAVNLAGRQRMLSQRMTKALLTVEIERSKAADPASLPDRTAEKAAAEELKSAVALFDRTFIAFQNGGTVTGGDGKPAELLAVDSPAAKEALAKALQVWTPYKEKALRVAQGNPTQQELSEAVAFARQNNVALLGLMNQLTTALEASASNRADTLRLVQTIGIVLALLNFAYILYKFLRSLRQADVALEVADAENKDILRSVREGLFLLEADGRIGTQVSASAGKLLGRGLMPGDQFLTVLQPLVSEKALQDARDYMALLFQPHIKENLVQSINPLDELELKVSGSTRHLSVSFNRVMEQGAVSHLLVTMQDISERITLQSQLNTEREKGAQEFALLVNAFRLSPHELDDFLKRAGASLKRVNEVFKGGASGNGVAQQQGFREAERLVHSIKGEASALDLRLLVHSAHALEDQLQQLKLAERPESAVVSVLIALDELMGRVQSIQSMNETRAPPVQADNPIPVPASAPAHMMASDISAPAPALDTPAEKLRDLLARIGQDLGKQYSAAVNWAEGLIPPHHAAAAQDIAIQLARNAAVHGIELPGSRLQVGKVAQGKIEVRVAMDDKNQVVLSVRDDGAGLRATTLRDRLKALAWYTQAQLDALTDQQVLAHILKPGFSTSTTVGEHAGRGVGLDVVNTQVKTIGARLAISTQAGHHTEFRVVWPVASAVLPSVPGGAT